MPKEGLPVVCPICRTKKTTHFFTLKNSPLLQNVLFSTEQEAKKTQRVDVDFLYCSACHFVFNPEFLESEIMYTGEYDNNQLSSKNYLTYIDEVVEKLIERCNLTPESAILEIGSGNGYFLSRLHYKLKCKTILGFDPTYKGQYGMGPFIRRTYFTPLDDMVFTLIIVRHAIESLVNYNVFWPRVLSAMHDQSHLYIETTNINYIIGRQDMSLLCHEYARYYSVKALQRLLGRYSLELRHLELLYNENYLGCFFQKQPEIMRFGSTCRKVAAITRPYKKVVIWGIAGRAISFLSHMNWGKKQVQFGVDIDRGKQGMFIPGTGQRVISPEEAASFSPDLVIIANANYLDEIRDSFPVDCDYATLDGRHYVSNRKI